MIFIEESRYEVAKGLGYDAGSDQANHYLHRVFLGPSLEMSSGLSNHVIIANRKFVRGIVQITQIAQFKLLRNT